MVIVGRSVTVLGILVMAPAGVVASFPVVDVPPPMPAPVVEAVPFSPGLPHVFVPGYWTWMHAGYRVGAAGR